jgi:hypothetical protein
MVKPPLFFAFFEAYEWISNSDTVFPAGKLIPDSIPKTTQLLIGRIHNRRALQELLSTSFRLRNPSAFISKLFISYSEQPSTGESLLSHLISLIYGSQFSAAAATADDPY